MIKGRTNPQTPFQPSPLHDNRQHLGLTLIRVTHLRPASSAPPSHSYSALFMNHFTAKLMSLLRY